MFTTTAMKREHQDLLRYVAKCVTGCIVMFGVGHLLPLRDISWVLISMVLVLSPDGKEAIPHTVVRIKANLMASAVTLLMLSLSPYLPIPTHIGVPLAITISVGITIVFCYLLKLMAGSRPALAAVIIIAMHPPGEYLWTTAEERVIAVIIGCVLALILTFVFHRGLTLNDFRSVKIFE